MSWVIVGIKENKRTYKFVENEDTALKIAMDWTEKHDEVMILEVKSKLIMRNPKEGEE